MGGACNRGLAASGGWLGWVSGLRSFSLGIRIMPPGCAREGRCVIALLLCSVAVRWVWCVLGGVHDGGYLCVNLL